MFEQITAFHLLGPIAALVGVLTYYVLGTRSSVLMLTAGRPSGLVPAAPGAPITGDVRLWVRDQRLGGGTRRRDGIAEPDDVEIALEAGGADKGPIAAVKTHAEYGESYASWHYQRIQHPQLRRFFDGIGTLPLADRVLLAIEWMLVLRQIHVRLYVDERGNTVAYADEEWSSICPFTAFWDYKGKTRTVLGETYPPHRPSLGAEWLLVVLHRHEFSYATDPDV